eukprot:TRINITY_DN4992_c0_g1_i1.p1 TRINITY_DN4992_c0_g1~~TRINITY_DN4992_c0_g1_i1.p1  ORF type:complete len:887 (-),score=451.89 TRINITY_DN4992_c0_g1_i1:10-2670(-)
MDDDYDTLLKKYANKSERPKDEEEGALDEHEDQSRDRRRTEKDTDKRRADKSRDKRDRSRDRRRSRERSRDRRRGSRERDRKRSKERERRTSREKSRDRGAAMEIDTEIERGASEGTRDENKWGGLRERSVDEWDSLRAELGLPPLEKSSAAVTSSAVTEPREQSEEREMSLADKLEVMKHARLMKQKEKKLKTLGDADSDEEQEGSSVNWIQRSRAIEEEKKRALMRQRMLEEEEEQARASRPVSVQGLKVGHELTQLDHDLREGEVRVLTLKDNYILDENGQEDELLDTTLLEKEKWEKIHNAKKKKSRYEVLDDPQASVLSKYDEEQKKEGFVLTGEGQVVQDTARPSPDEVRDKLQRAAQSLDTPAPSTSSDYFTNEEIAEFKKNSGPKKKKRKLRKKSALSELFDQEAAHPQQGADEDLASRSARQQRQEEQTAQDRDTRLQRWKNYDKALEKAQGDAEMLFDQPKRGEQRESEVTYHEDEEDLFRELARARKLAARDRKKKRPEEVVSELLTSVKREEEAVPASTNDEELVFTESTEFVRSLPTEQDERQEEQERKMKRERRTVHVKKEPVPHRDEDTLMREIEADQPVIRPPAPRRVESDEVAVKEEKHDSTPAESESESVQREHAALSEAMGDTGTDVRGVGGMLAMLRSMGESSPSNTAPNNAKEGQKKDKDERRPKRLDAELALGRATDKRVHEVPLNDERETEALQRRYRHELGMLKKPLNLNGITLEHHDQETGRLLTPKEAFRRMSYVFHGKGPGKNKAEKRKKQDEKRLKQLTQHSMGTETISMQEMQKIQQENKTPYIVLGASAKIFQARDTKPLSTAPTSTSTNHNNNTNKSNNNNSGSHQGQREESEYGISLPSHRPKIELSFKTPAKK